MLSLQFWSPAPQLHSVAGFQLCESSCSICYKYSLSLCQISFKSSLNSSHSIYVCDVCVSNPKLLSWILFTLGKRRNVCIRRQVGATLPNFDKNTVFFWGGYCRALGHMFFIHKEAGQLLTAPIWKLIKWRRAIVQRRSSWRGYIHPLAQILMGNA